MHGDILGLKTRLKACPQAAKILLLLSNTPVSMLWFGHTEKVYLQKSELQNFIENTCLSCAAKFYLILVTV